MKFFPGGLHVDGMGSNGRKGIVVVSHLIRALGWQDGSKSKGSCHTSLNSVLGTHVEGERETGSTMSAVFSPPHAVMTRTQ